MSEDHLRKEALLDRVDRALIRDRRWLGALLGFAFFLKLIYIVQSADSIQVTVPILDAQYYDDMAQDIARGRLIRREAFFMGPLYPYFLAALYSTFGRNFMLVRLIQIFGGSVTVVLTYLLGKRVFRPSVALVAALMLSLYGAVTFYEGQLLMMWLGTLITITMLYTLYAKSNGMDLKRYALAGVLLGLSALARANILIFLPLVLVWILFIKKTNRFATAGVFVLATVVMIIPATLHNYIASADFVPITSNGGVNFYIGNNEVARGHFYPPKGIDFITDATTRKYIEKRLGKDMKPSEVSNYWLREGLDFIRRDPMGEVKLLLRKTALFLSGYEIPQIESYDLSREKFGSLRMLFLNIWFLGSLGAVGMIYTLRRWREYFLLYGFIISYGLSIILFFVTARYRVQIVPVLSLFAAYALIEVFPRSLRSLRRVFVPLLLFALILTLTQPSLFELPRNQVEWHEHIHQARRFGRVGNHNAAIEEINKAIALFPDHPDSYLHRAIIYKDSGKLFQAVEDYSRALEIAPGTASVHYDLAQTLRELKMYELASEEYLKAIALDSLMLQAYNNLGVTYRDMKEFGKAIECFKIVIERDPGYIKAYNNLGACLAESGQIEGAIEIFRKAIQVDPNYAGAYKNLAMVYVQSRRSAEAYVYLRHYLSLNPGDRQAQTALQKLRMALEGDTLDAAP